MPTGTPNKFSKPGQNIHERSQGFSLMEIAKVEGTIDEFDGDRIKARIKGIDDHLETKELPLAFPLMPKFYNVKPKIGETVIIMKFQSENDFENRLYVGPIISQPQKLGKDNHLFSSQSLLDTGYSEPEQTPSNIPEARGVYPNPQDVAIQGRGNTDMIFKKNEVLIRSGKFVEGDRLSFNEKNPGYIQIRNNATVGQTENDEDRKGTVTNIVASKINLLTHENGEPRFNLANREKMISDSELETILEDAHPIVFGDRLKEFFELLKTYIKNHVHPYHGMVPDETDTVKRIMNFNLDNLLSKNVKAN